jgi:hypothetical protein
MRLVDKLLQNVTSVSITVLVVSGHPLSSDVGTHFLVWFLGSNSIGERTFPAHPSHICDRSCERSPCDGPRGTGGMNVTDRRRALRPTLVWMGVQGRLRPL